MSERDTCPLGYRDSVPFGAILRHTALLRGEVRTLCTASAEAPDVNSGFIHLIETTHIARNFRFHLELLVTADGDLMPTTAKIIPLVSLILRPAR